MYRMYILYKERGDNLHNGTCLYICAERSTSSIYLYRTVGEQDGWCRAAQSCVETVIQLHKISFIGTHVHMHKKKSVRVNTKPLQPGEDVYSFALPASP